MLPVGGGLTAELRHKPETSFDDRCDRNAASAQIEEREENAVC